MATDELTLKAFFCKHPDQPIEEAVDLTPARLDVERAAAGKVPRAALPNLHSAFNRAVDSVFKIRVADILQRTWSKAPAVKEHLVTTRTSQSAMLMVPLLDHSVVSRHEPRIDLLYGAHKLAELALQIAVTMDMKGVELDLRKGRVHGLNAGSCLGRGHLAFQGRSLIEQTTPEFPLLGRLTFRPEEEAD